MASIRPRSDSRGRPTDGPRSRRMGGVMDTSNVEVTPTTGRTARRGAENTASVARSSSQSRTSQQSRIPKSPLPRKQTGPNISARPPLTHETQSWSMSSGSGRSAPSSTPATGECNEPPKQPRNVLRRKQSSVSKDPANLRKQSRSDSGRTGSSSSIPRSQTSIDLSVPYLDRSITASPVEIRTAQKVDLPRAAVQGVRVYPELDRYRDIQLPPSRDGPGIDVPYRLTTEDLPPPTPLFSGASSHSQLSTFSASPSTRFSESPGPGPYSRDTTPTSMSSQSPGLVAPMFLSKVRQASPAETRPPVTRRRAGSASNEGDSLSADAPGLAAVRELTSSSSNSTVRAGDIKEKKSRRGRSPAPPNPPPRKSSQKPTKDRGGVEPRSPSRTSRRAAQPVMRSPSPTKVARPSFDRDRQAEAPPQPRPTPPSRPSRDGTPDLYSQFGGPVPIIHSNLSATSIGDRGHSGQLAPNSLPRATTPSSSQERTTSAKPPLNRRPTPAPTSGIPTSTQPSKAEAGRATRTPSPSVASTFKSRFPLFGRRAKTATEVPQPEKKEKPIRKGPAAGTGHEGYGRLGAIKRRSSNPSNLPRGLTGPVSSSESLASTQSTDPFLLERMNPVVIAGGEVVENRNASSELTRTESRQSVLSSRPSVGSRNNSSVSLSSGEDTRHTLWPSAFPRSSIHASRPSDSSDSEAVVMKSTIALRRSAKGHKSPDSAPVNIPKPIMIRGASSASVGSIETAVVTDDSVPDSRPEPIRQQRDASGAPKKLTKRAKSPRKWNLFSRSQNATAAKKPVEASVSAAVQPAQTKPVAFYTMMDSSEQEDTEEPDVRDILRQAEVLDVPGTSPDVRQRRPSTSERSHQGLQLRTAQRQNERLQPTRREPSIPRVQPAARPHQQQTNANLSASASTRSRPSRLPQVGRIPKVVNSRPAQASPKSFSRPFNRVSLQLPPPPPAGQADRDSIAKGPSPPKSSSPELTEEEAFAQHKPDDSQTQDPSPELGRPGKEFLAFSPVKSSECTASTGSSSSGMVGYTAHTAVLPEPTAPLGEDEVWDEYNDLLGDPPPSATSSRGAPFHLETYESKPAEESTKPLVSPTLTTQNGKDVRDSIQSGKAATSSSHYSADMTARINAAFKFGSDPPATPFSVSEFVSGYGDRDSSNVQLAKAPESTRRDSASSNQSIKAKGAPSQRSSGSSRNSEETPLSQVNLRVGSMTVSKWLTFGHVLFSPVREELVNAVGSLKRHSILVIDGLGNDDWSFYAAETYPAATFYNLSPRAPLPQEHQPTSSFPLSPPNHHQIQFTSHRDKFHFGPDSFTSVVFRFPSAAPEAHYRNIISEARRVLKPGGYIELAVLDVDLNNMGNRTRRSVRRLKERVNTKHPDLNLSSTADLILRLLGKKGFVDIKSCRVGVPVASAVTNSSGSKGKRDERSLAEMMNDETEMGDENITKMVSKVGRWWYNRCYELPTGMTKSIWNDRSLLAECEEWGTSLKLMVCHARMPEAGGRVASI